MTQIKLIFTVFGDFFNLESFTKVSKINPTSYWTKGDVVPNRKNNLTRKETSWEYSFEFIQTLFFEEVSNLFLSTFRPSIEEIAKYVNTNNLQTKIDFVVEIVNNEKPSILFSKDFMDIIVKINGEIDIDLYIIDK
jgi:hypothetical protein